MIFLSRELAHRRAILIRRCARQREVFVTEITQFRKGIPLLRLSFGLVSKLREHPWLYTSLATTLILIRPRRFFTLPKAACAVFSTIKWLNPLIKGIGVILKR